MYNERAKVEFYSEVTQSERLRFLADMASQLEQSGRQSENSPGFSIVFQASGHTKVDVWQPGKWQVLVQCLRVGEELKLLRVTEPKQFSEWYMSGSDNAGNS